MIFICLSLLLGILIKYTWREKVWIDNIIYKDYIWSYLLFIGLHPQWIFIGETLVAKENAVYYLAFNALENLFYF